VGWRVRGVRGATTVEANTYAALERAVLELMEEIEAQNDIDPSEIVSATFSATTDIDVVFPAKIARSRSHWELTRKFEKIFEKIEGVPSAPSIF